MVTPGLPPQTNAVFAVGSGGARKRPEVSHCAEPEASGLCDDAAMQEQGVSKILTINLNDMAKELKIQ